MSLRESRRDILMGACSPTWEGHCISQKSPLHRSLPRRRRGSTSMTARAGPFPTRFERYSHVSFGRPDWLAGVGGLELRNVVAKYPFERSHRFPVIQPNSGQRDHSRLNCGVGKRNGASCIRNLSISKGRNGSRNFSTAWFVVLHLDAAFLAAPIGLRAFYHFLAVEPK